MAGTTYGALYSDLYDPPFPQSPIGTEVELYLGSWTDITPYVYQRDPIAISDGRPDESSQVNPSQCTLTLNNRDNRFSINNPMGPYYGLLGRNSPLRVSLPTALLPSPYDTSYLRMETDDTSYASCQPASQLEITGSIDVRIDLEITGYSSWSLVSRWGGSYQLGIGTSGVLGFRYTPDGVTAYQVNSSAQTPAPVGRQVLRWTFDTVAEVVTFYTAPAGGIDSGPWTQLGAAQPIPSAAQLNAGTVGIGIGPVYGAVYDMELRNGVGGAIVARPAFNTLTAGTTAWRDAYGNTWSVNGTAEISNRSYRYHGELSQTPKAADPTATDVYSQATASGVLRRLQQAQNPINSPMYRAYVRATGTSAPAAYWPCEDQAASTQLASGLPGGIGLQISGAPELSADSTLASSAPLPTLNGATFRGTVPQGTGWTENTLQLVTVCPASPTSEANGEVIASLYTNGTVARMDLCYETGAPGGFLVNGYSAAGATLFAGSGISPIDGAINGAPVLVGIGLYLSGGVVQWQISVMPPSAEIVATGGAVAGASIGVPTQVVVNPNGTAQQVALGHVAVINNQPADLAEDYFYAFNAWSGETAANRVSRLCSEEGIDCRIVGHPELSVQMGYQTLETIPELLQECETTDRGFLFEPRTTLGLGYRTLYSLYNQAPRATADYAAAQLAPAFSSTADDLITINDVTVTNLDGSSARQVLESGPMSVLSPPLGVGRVDTEIEVNSLSDGNLATIANWILHVSTDAHDRFPVIPFNMARSQTPAAVALLQVGDLAAITNPPAWLQPDDIEQIAAGRAETFGPAAVWEIDVNGIPAYPYTVAQVAGAGGSAVHVDTDGSWVSAYASASADTLSVASLPDYPVWTQNGADFPFDINVAGERITVTGIAGASSPQTFAVTRSVNGVAKPQQPNTPVALWYTPIVGQITGA